MTVSAWVVVGLAVAVVLLGSLLKNVGWSDKVKQALVVVLSVVGGVVSVWQAGALNGASDVLQTATLVYGASQLIYAFIFKGTGVEQVLAEVKVLPGPAPEPVVDETPVVVDVPADVTVVDNQANSDDFPGA